MNLLADRKCTTKAEVNVASAFLECSLKYTQLYSLRFATFLLTNGQFLQLIYIFRACVAHC